MVHTVQQLFFVGVLIVVARFTRVDGVFSGTASPQNSSNASSSQRKSVAAVVALPVTAHYEAGELALPAKVLNAKSILAISLSQ